MSVFNHFFGTVQQVLHKAAKQAIHYADMVLPKLVHHDATLQALETL